ncbi:hypothetical protein, partial [Rhizobium favelukesii]|uniref:hypothetical protein n=1 Tax=Rhizobium favelukesii TaxID=348824 RepID=UPI00215F5618
MREVEDFEAFALRKTVATNGEKYIYVYVRVIYFRAWTLARLCTLCSEAKCLCHPLEAAWLSFR